MRTKDLRETFPAGFLYGVAIEEMSGRSPADWSYDSRDGILKFYLQNEEIASITADERQGDEYAILRKISNACYQTSRVSENGGRRRRGE